MTLQPDFFSDFLRLIGAVIFFPILLLAARKANWWRLKNHRDFNILINATVCVAIVWYMRVDFPSTYSPHLSGLNLHLLGSALMAMMFGWSFSVIAMTLVVLFFTLLTGTNIYDSLTMLPWNALLTAVLPVSLVSLIFQFSHNRLPNNFFIYIFVCTFFGAALSMASVIGATSLMHIYTDTYSSEILDYSYIPYGLILMFPEAFMTGMLMTIFVVYRPEWVTTFDDQRYLYRKK